MRCSQDILVVVIFGSTCCKVASHIRRGKYVGRFLGWGGEGRKGVDKYLSLKPKQPDPFLQYVLLSLKQTNETPYVLYFIATIWGRGIHRR